MDNQVLLTALLATAFLVLFATAELLYHKFGIKAELTRKFVHVGTGALTLLFPVLLKNHWYVLFLCASFAAILLVSLRFNLLKSINAIDRKSHGSISYPIAVYGTYLYYSLHIDKELGYSACFFFYLPILTLAICDPVAALFGKRWHWGPYKLLGANKSMLGSFMFFVSAFLLCFVLGYFLFGELPFGFFVYAAIAALGGTIAEAFGGKGLDNLSVPGINVLILYLLVDTTAGKQFISSFN